VLVEALDFEQLKGVKGGKNRSEFNKLWGAESPSNSIRGT